jgi:cell division protein FtsB
VKIAIIFLAVVFCIIVGFAARQMQDLRDKDEKIKAQSEEFEKLIRENEALRGSTEKIEGQAHRIENLLRANESLRHENEGLRRDSRDHETNLEMVLAELDPKQEVNA